MNQRINSIIQHESYQLYYKKIQSLEEERPFCKHDMAHFLDVARIATILSLEENSGVSREMIYAAALLHDIGRHEQYLQGIPHEKSSASLSFPILESCGFTPEEISEIQIAILNHRTFEVAVQKDLSGYLYRGDKASRSCHSCKQETQCSWPSAKKNMYITY